MLQYVRRQAPRVLLIFTKTILQAKKEVHKVGMLDYPTSGELSTYTNRRWPDSQGKQQLPGWMSNCLHHLPRKLHLVLLCVAAVSLGLTAWRTGGASGLFAASVGVLARSRWAKILGPISAWSVQPTEFVLLTYFCFFWCMWSVTTLFPLLPSCLSWANSVQSSYRLQ